jgi:hypothetical protein
LFARRGARIRLREVGEQFCPSLCKVSHYLTGQEEHRKFQANRGKDGKIEDPVQPTKTFSAQSKQTFAAPV